MVFIYTQFRASDILQKKIKISADFVGFMREKSQNSWKNQPIARDFSRKNSNFEGFSGANS